MAYLQECRALRGDLLLKRRCTVVCRAGKHVRPGFCLTHLQREPVEDTVGVASCSKIAPSRTQLEDTLFRKELVWAASVKVKHRLELTSPRRIQGFWGDVSKPLALVPGANDRDGRNLRRGLRQFDSAMLGIVAGLLRARALARERIDQRPKLTTTTVNVFRGRRL